MGLERFHAAGARRQRVRWGGSPWLCLRFVIDATLWKVPPHPPFPGPLECSCGAEGPGREKRMCGSVCVASALHLGEFHCLLAREKPFSPKFTPCPVPGMLLSSNAGSGGRIAVPHVCSVVCSSTSWGRVVALCSTMNPISLSLGLYFVCV